MPTLMELVAKAPGAITPLRFTVFVPLIVPTPPSVPTARASHSARTGAFESSKAQRGRSAIGGALWGVRITLIAAKCRNRTRCSERLGAREAGRANFLDTPSD